MINIFKRIKGSNKSEMSLLDTYEFSFFWKKEIGSNKSCYQNFLQKNLDLETILKHPHLDDFRHL